MAPTNPASTLLPEHLKTYIVDQDYDRYSPIDQSVWRYIMRQLRSYLGTHAHRSYLGGLEKTGIKTDEIPRIDEMSTQLQKFGWTAAPVSGFIPPAAFMEMQSLGVLPIASDIRSIEHIAYTPAPDIVHEAAGHAPILVDPDYAAYLKDYAQVAKKAILGRDDISQYEAIRVLSDLKEDPEASEQQILQAEKHLEEVNQKMRYVSEASWLSRMNWWTAEYGLVGDINQPKIFGAGLLSSVGESQLCLSDAVKKINLDVNCVDYGYDITEPQPQLFVTPSFQHLKVVLQRLTEKMAYKRGGSYGLERAIEAETINTIELDSGLQISGVVKQTLYQKDQPVFFKLDGPTQLSFGGVELDGHGCDFHSHGFSSPLGLLDGQSRCLSLLSEPELQNLGIAPDRSVSLRFQSGFEVRGRVNSVTQRKSRNILIQLAGCTATYKGDIYFQPEWGVFDMALGCEVRSVFAGPADPIKYLSEKSVDFVQKRVARKSYTDQEQTLHALYQKVRDVRQQRPADATLLIDQVCDSLDESYEDEWLIRLEILELIQQQTIGSGRKPQIAERLENLGSRNEQLKNQISSGFSLIEAP